MGLSRQIQETLLYGDIFEYPFTKEELWKYLHGLKPVSYDIFLKTLQHLPDSIVYKNGFYFLARRKDGVRNRRERKHCSQKKQDIAISISRLLAFLPTVQFVGISGSVAMSNAKKQDDIDLFIITKKKTIWLTRFLSVVLISLLGKRRSREGKKTSDMICLNFFIDERALTFPKSRHDIYTAHEIAQVVPLVNRSFTYERFLLANSWVRGFLPNAYGDVQGKGGGVSKSAMPFWVSFFEFLAKTIQLCYMKPREKGEFISDTILAFHPGEYRTKTLQVFAKKRQR